MEVQKNLNNIQRKMLDGIYTEEFNTISNAILNKRKEAYEKLKSEIIKEESAKEPVKTLLKKAAEAKQAFAKAVPYMKERGLKLESHYDYKDWGKLEIKGANSWSDSSVHPKLVEFRAETQRIELELAKKKKEIRAKIHGLNTTYEVVEREIKEELKSLKV